MNDNPTGADLVQTAAAELADLLDDLAALLPEPIGDPTVGTTAHRKHVAGSPAPWHQEAGMVLMTAHEGVRRLEASMRRDVTGGLGRRRGGSLGNTSSALAAVCNLSYGVPDASARKATRIIGIWISQAKVLRDIDQAPRWEPLRTAPAKSGTGRLAPACPYCSTYSLRTARVSGAVRCFNPACRDNNGDAPCGQLLEAPYTGHPMIVWADGREIITYPAAEAS